MLPNLPSQLLPYADEYERLIRTLIYLETQDGRSWFVEGEATDLLHEADLVSRAYIEYTQKHSGFHDRYFTNLAKYLVELSENLSKRRDEDPLVTAPLTETFVLKKRAATGAAVGVALIHAMESICERIQELKLEEFVATKLNTAALRVHKKAVLMGQVKELYDKAFAGDTTNLEGLVELAKSAVEEKRGVSINISTESELDQLVWRCHRVELVLGDVSFFQTCMVRVLYADLAEKVHEMMDRREDEKRSDLWKTSTLEWCQLASRYCQELKDEVIKYLNLHPGSMLPRNSANSLPVIDTNLLIGRSYRNLSIGYKNALKDFVNVLVGAMKEAEGRKLRAEVECVVAQNLLELRERQLAATRSTQPANPSLSVPLSPEETRGYSLEEYVNFVVELRVKEARRIFVLSEVWNLRLNWTRGRETREQQEQRMNLGLFYPNIQKGLKELISDGRDHTRAREPLGWWVSDLEE